MIFWPIEMDKQNLLTRDHYDITIFSEMAKADKHTSCRRIAY